MIYLPQRQIVIITPPKCATHSLHDLLCSAEFGGQHVIGASLDSANQDEPRVDWHCATVPVQAANCRVFGMWRDPRDRLVSLFHHYVTFESARGRGTPGFRSFCQLIARSQLGDRFYEWNLKRFYQDVRLERLLAVDRLKEELIGLGLPAVPSLPRLLTSHRSRPTEDYFDPDMNETIEEWCGGDALLWANVNGRQG